MNTMNIPRIAGLAAMTALVGLAATPVGARESTWANGPGGSGGNGSGGSGVVTSGPKAVGCAPSTAIAVLELNNVRARIETGGSMWQNRATGNAAYFVPKSADQSIPGPSPLFAGALWMGGISPDNQLKLAAVRFRQVGNDFWPGPLTNTGDASVTAETCQAYDRFWRTERNAAAEHLAFYNCLADPDCDQATEFPNGYVTPISFLEWPAIGDVSQGQDLYIAPFQDYNGDGDYQPSDGDYPQYDLNGTIDCKSKFREDPVPLFGDENLWWVFNDKGNVHTETGGLPIGMEIRAQAFAFSTNDEVNNMTFYNYVLINQGTQTLTNAYFGQWVDADLGCSNDDYVGCDVERGLGYAYNGTDNDVSCNGVPGYGQQPPAVGVDFFEGPYQDEDGVDNPLTTDCNVAVAQKGIVYKGIGIGYGDGVADNERYGMRAFLYHDNNNGVRGDPSIAIQYYNYLRGIWKDGTPNTYGGTGYTTVPGAQRAEYMFPGDSDPLGWGTECLPQASWTEENSNNAPADRRFIQSAGPFTLEAGAYNNITVGVVYARATGGGPFASVEEVRGADDKAQSLFDNCFQILNGPDAPDLALQELDRELILYIKNSQNGNNYQETYEELDPTIPESASDRFYRFQGYQIYQLKDADVSVSDLGDVNKARLVAQCDKEDNVAQLVNYILDPAIGLPVPTEMVNGGDTGVFHSLRITEDLFASGDPRLINFKTYYFLAIAYGYNDYEDYNPSLLTGQAFPYIASRKSATGSIRSYSGIPHKPSPEAGGTVQNTSYGDQFQITRFEGQGNGSIDIDLEQSTIDQILSGAPWRQDELKYKVGKGPITVKVIDPLNVPEAEFEVWFLDSTAQPTMQTFSTYDEYNDAYWYIVNTTTNDTVWSDQSIEVGYEQLLLDWGISITIEQAFYTDNDDYTDPLGSEITYADPSKAWYAGIPDIDGEFAFNWIRAGTSDDEDLLYPDYVTKDDEQKYEKVLFGTWSPWPLVGDTTFQPVSGPLKSTTNLAQFSEMSSCLVVMTQDKSKWTRVPVLEMCETEVYQPEIATDDKLGVRSKPSLDKNGRKNGDGGYNASEGDLVNSNGMSWFPGYAIDLETGERLNMAFGEDSFWGGAIGRDMMWNPNDVLTTQLGDPLFAGGHWIFVFKNERRMMTTVTSGNNRMPQYDEASWMMSKLLTNTTTELTRVFRAVNWVGSAALIPGTTLLSMEDGVVPTETRFRLGVVKPYMTYVQPYTEYTPAITPARNEGRNLYGFSTTNGATQLAQNDVAVSALDLIGIVPNPYYAYSGYETNRLDNRVKFINLPKDCTISIYNTSGTLVRKFRKGSELTYLDWDLKNQVNVPIAGGVYICHIDAPGIGEKVIKWFGVMRPVDLQNF